MHNIQPALPTFLFVIAQLAGADFPSVRLVHGHSVDLYDNSLFRLRISREKQLRFSTVIMVLPAVGMHTDCWPQARSQL